MAACSSFSVYLAPYKDGNTVRAAMDAYGSCGTWHINLKRDRWGPDQVLSTASKWGSGRMGITAGCDWTGTWGMYVEGYEGSNSLASAPLRYISC